MAEIRGDVAILETTAFNVASPWRFRFKGQGLTLRRVGAFLCALLQRDLSQTVKKKDNPACSFIQCPRPIKENPGRPGGAGSGAGGMAVMVAAVGATA